MTPIMSCLFWHANLDTPISDFENMLIAAIVADWLREISVLLIRGGISTYQPTNHGLNLCKKISKND